MWSSSTHCSDFNADTFLTSYPHNLNKPFKKGYRFKTKMFKQLNRRHIDGQFMQTQYRNKMIMVYAVCIKLGRNSYSYKSSTIVNYGSSAEMTVKFPL